MTDHILATAKAYAALIGAIITAILGTVPPHTAAWTILTVVAAVLTALATYVVPNQAAVVTPLDSLDDHADKLAQ